jgi:transcription initiation factor IIF auxiliary subunit
MREQYKTVTAFSRLDSKDEYIQKWEEKENEFFQVMKSELSADEMALFVQKLRADIIRHIAGLIALNEEKIENLQYDNDSLHKLTSQLK